MNLIKKLFVNDVYVKVGPDCFEIKNLSTNGGWKRVKSEIPFTTERLLVGTFSVAESVLKKLLKSVMEQHFFSKSPRIVIHPTSMVEGGLSEVEATMYKELALGSGGFKVAVHVGAELTDSAARKLLENA